MKRTFVIIILLIIFCGSVVLASNTSNISLTQSKSKVNDGDELEIVVSLNDIADIQEGINAYQGKITYDTNIFETVKETSFTTRGAWMGLLYNPQNGQYVIERKQVGHKDENVLRIILKVKKDLNLKEDIETKISFTDNIISGGVKDINLEDKTIYVTLERKNIPKENNDNQNSGNGNVEVSNTQKWKYGLYNGKLPNAGMATKIILVLVIVSLIVVITAYIIRKKLS